MFSNALYFRNAIGTLFFQFIFLDEETRRVPEPKPIEVAEPPIHEEIKKEIVLGKRPIEPTEEGPDCKKPCIEEPPILEDDLSEISDDADEILNREDVSTIFKLLFNR